MRRLIVALATLFIVAALPAAAHDHRPPKAVLHVEDDRQVGRRHHADWVRGGKRFCTATFAIGFPTFRKPLRHAPGRPLVIRLHKKAPPLEVEVHRWPRVNKDGRAAGTPVPLPWALSPRMVDGQIRAWDVTVAWPASVDHLYLGAAAYWADEEDCAGEPDLGSQYVAWTFHLKGTPLSH